MQNQWSLEGLDLSTAFLQTEKNQESKRLWTEGTRELRAALGVSDGGLLRILKDFYGSTTAPRGLWQDIDRKLRSLQGHKILGDPCVWIWTKPNPKPQNDLDKNILLGYMCGHVDDFIRSGDDTSQEWLDIKKRIDQSYKWGSSKRGQFRYVGCDVEEKTDTNGLRYIEINQDFYVETLMNLEISLGQSVDPTTPLSKSDVARCRASLGALQWLAVQTQPLLCARCNLLLSELARSPKASIAFEI